MATVWRTNVRYSTFHGALTLDRERGETVMVPPEMFVRLPHGTMLPLSDQWHYDQRSADLAVLPDLEARRGEIQALIDSIRLLPAAAAAHGLAAGSAHAEVAT